jgi:hypothetical protein
MLGVRSEAYSMTTKLAFEIALRRRKFNRTEFKVPMELPAELIVQIMELYPGANSPINAATEQIADEVARAMGLHKELASLHEAKAVIEEELEEFWELVKVNPKKLDEEDRVRRLADLRMELIQAAAMCVRAIVDLGL